MPWARRVPVTQIGDRRPLHQVLLDDANLVLRTERPAGRADFVRHGWPFLWLAIPYCRSGKVQFQVNRHSRSCAGDRVRAPLQQTNSPPPRFTPLPLVFSALLNYIDAHAGHCFRISLRSSWGVSTRFRLARQVIIWSLAQRRKRCTSGRTRPRRSRRNSARGAEPSRMRPWTV